LYTRAGVHATVGNINQDQDAGESCEDQDEDEEVYKPDPQAAANKLLQAEQELLGMTDLITSVESMHTVGVQYANNGRSAADQLRKLVIARETRRRQLRSAAARLQDAAAQLTAKFQRDNAYVRDLSCLQVRCGLSSYRASM
jgi:hypothetical protein